MVEQNNASAATDNADSNVDNAACCADTRETAEEWKRDVEKLQVRIENTSGEIRRMLQKQLQQLLRQKDKK